VTIQLTITFNRCILLRGIRCKHLLLRPYRSARLPYQIVLLLNFLSPAHVIRSATSLTLYNLRKIIIYVKFKVGGTAVAQWLRCCATNRKVAGSIPAGVIGIFN